MDEWMKILFQIPITQPHLHSKQCWVVRTQIWGKYGQTQMLG